MQGIGGSILLSGRGSFVYDIKRQLDNGRYNLAGSLRVWGKG